MSLTACLAFQIIHVMGNEKGISLKDWPRVYQLKRGLRDISQLQIFLQGQLSLSYCITPCH